MILWFTQGVFVLRFQKFVHFNVFGRAAYLVVGASSCVYRIYQLGNFVGILHACITKKFSDLNQFSHLLTDVGNFKEFNTTESARQGNLRHPRDFEGV